MWGADVAQLRTLAQTFGKASETLLQQSTQLGRLINNDRGWNGPDALKFKSDWNSGHRTLVMNAASALKKQSRFLLTQADEQEKASNGAHGSGGGPLPGSPGGGPGGANDPYQLGPDWLADGKNSPFRRGWDAYNGVLGLKTVPLALRDTYHFLQAEGGVVRDLWKEGSRFDALRYGSSSDLWKMSANADELRGAFSGTADLLGGSFGDFANMARSGTDAAELSKAATFGLNSAGHVLGGVGVALDGLDAVNSYADGDIGSGIKSTLKVALGVGSFMPPPVGVACMAISGIWAVSELMPGVSDAIDKGFDKAWDAVSDVGKGVKDFFGF